jgi:hypothetical protein
MPKPPKRIVFQLKNSQPCLCSHCQKIIQAGFTYFVVSGSTAGEKLHPRCYRKLYPIEELPSEKGAQASKKRKKKRSYPDPLSTRLPGSFGTGKRR